MSTIFLASLSSRRLNAKGHFGPPKFEAAAFRFSGGRTDLKITITYL